MTRSHILYWIWLSLCVSPGSKTTDVLLEHFEENAQKIHDAQKSDYDALDLPEDLKEKLCRKDSEESRKILSWCKAHDVRLLAYDDPAFPARLRRIPARPVLLYCKGKNIDLNNGVFIAMVGTRKMSSYGQRTAYAIAHDAACAGACIVSGMALGIDAVCHRGALDAGGDTVAVLGCGVDIAYPKQNLDLMLELERKGLIVSEYRPGSRPTRFSFPIRNRIISGLCQGTFAVEGGRDSGAMITARCAQAQGRDLFSLPGMVGEENSEGTNALLREGAVPVTNAAELLSDYALLYPDKVFLERIPVYRPEIVLTPVPGKHPQKERREEPAPENAGARNKEIAAQDAPEFASNAPLPEPEKTAPAGLNDDCRALFDILNAEKQPLTGDRLTELSGLPASNVLTALTILEIKGVILSLPGGRFILN